MLSQEDNELITRVGPGTPMGVLLRHFWIPFLFGWEVTVDGPPERVRLLGEDLIVFRNSAGCVGLIAEHCPHRGAALFFGRNEENGLRCVYHGWKYDIAGRCVDMPSEHPESTFKERIRARAYPCVERSGIVWAYLGPSDPPPPLPALEWLDLPADHHVGSKRVQYSNWVQAIEGDIDQSHVSFVHSRLNLQEGAGPGRMLIDEIRKADTHPRFEVIDTNYGVCIGAGREAPDGEHYWRITQHLMPFHTMTGPYGPDPRRNWRAWVPIDDETCFVIGLSFHPLRPITAQEQEIADRRGSVWNISPPNREPKSSMAFGRWRPIPDLCNDFFIDRKVQRTQTYSGISEFWAQDAGPQLSMGRIVDRTQEHLGTSDTAIIAVRRRLLEAAKALGDEGKVPPQAHNPACYAVRGDAVLIPATQSWFDATIERRKVLTGVNPDCP